MTDAAERLEFLRGIPLFSDLDGPDLERLLGVTREVSRSPGEQLFAQGDAGDYAYVIEDGQVDITCFSDGREIPLATRGRGEVIGEMALLDEEPRMASARASTAVKCLAIGREQLDKLLGASPSAARAMLATVTARLRETEAALRQSEKMAQLGTLTAGLAHELNNPASAALRGAEHLRQALAVILDGPRTVADLQLSPRQFEELGRRLSNDGPHAGPAGPLERSDRAEAVEEWMRRRGLDDGGRFAAELAEAGYDAAELERMTAVFTDQQLGRLLPLVCAAAAARQLLEEIGHGAGEIATIVRAMKSYVYLDQAPVQEVDIHESLENTLVILRHKLKNGIRVTRDFAPDLPLVSAHGSELNQVWTNLIDNAADALGGSGDITLRTRHDEPWVRVQVHDNGPGIPVEARPRIFTLFFTTKPIGKGTGLGLATAYKIIRSHGGTIDFESRPGSTTFTVTLPRRARMS
jgi:signal transduction histidine kinase